jgi:hypothetical protein
MQAEGASHRAPPGTFSGVCFHGTRGAASTMVNGLIRFILYDMLSAPFHNECPGFDTARTLQQVANLPQQTLSIIAVRST